MGKPHQRGGILKTKGRRSSVPRDFFELLSSRLKAKFGEMLLFMAEEEQAIENQR